MPLEELGACGADDQQRDVVGAVHEVLDEGEQVGVRPMEILEDDDGGTVGGHVLEEPPPCQEGLFLRGYAATLDPDQGAEALAEPRPLFALRQDGLELPGSDVNRV